MPTPNPTAAQLESVRDMARLSSLNNATILVNRLTDAQWAAQLDAILEWEDAKHDNVRVTGRVQLSPKELRELLTSETRIRLGLPERYSSTSLNPMYTSTIIKIRP